MTYEEFTGWCLYFKQRPIGWREDNRTHMLLQVQGVKEPGHKLFASLDAIRKSSTNNKDFASNLKGSAIFRQMLNAKGGDKLEIFNESNSQGD